MDPLPTPREVALDAAQRSAALRHHAEDAEIRALVIRLRFEARRNKLRASYPGSFTHEVAAPTETTDIAANA